MARCWPLSNRLTRMSSQDLTRVRTVDIDTSAMIGLTISRPRQTCLRKLTHKLGTFQHPLPEYMYTVGAQAERLRWSVVVSCASAQHLHGYSAGG